MRLQFTIYKKDDNIMPIISIINEYLKDYVCIDAEITRRGISNNHSLYIDLDIQRETKYKKYEIKHEAIDIIALIQKGMKEFDKPVTWEESIKKIHIGSDEFADLIDILKIIKKENAKMSDFSYKIEESGDVILTLEFTEEK